MDSRKAVYDVRGVVTIKRQGVDVKIANSDLREHRTPQREIEIILRKLRELPEHATMLREQYHARLKVLGALVY
jgi:hypothetical protein